MAFHDFDYSAKQIFLGNFLLIICCAFYLAWWLVAFKPTGAIKGMKSGWLLIPAFIFGIFAIALALRGVLSASVDAVLFPGKYIVWGGIAAYLILLAVTGLLLKRKVTTELFLIDGWAMLALSEVNVLYGMGQFSHGPAVIFIIVIGIATLISMVCYVMYYNLGVRAGYYDGMVPLLLVAFVMSGIFIAMLG